LRAFKILDTKSYHTIVRPLPRRAAVRAAPFFWPLGQLLPPIGKEKAMSFMNGYVTEHDLAEQVGVSVFTLRAWRRKKYGPPSAKLGKLVVYRQLDVDEFMSSIFDGKDGEL
jgi:hypothetical protein